MAWISRTYPPCNAPQGTTARAGRWEPILKYLDEKADISDTIHILGYVFQDQEEPGCLDAADVNDDGYISVADGIHIINYMFAGGEEPPSPGATTCGTDPTDDDGLDCQVTASNCL